MPRSERFKYQFGLVTGILQLSTIAPSWNDSKLAVFEGIYTMKGCIEIDQELCKGCEICISFCPKDSISISDKLNAAGYLPVRFNGNGECTGCAICALVCPEVAIEVYRG